MKKKRLKTPADPRDRGAKGHRKMPARSILALSISAALSGNLAMAQEEEPVELDTMRIQERTIDTNPYSEPGAPYKAKISGDSRHVKPLADTPQTIEVLTQTRIEESGKSDMRDVLSTLPGITIGTGEGGNAFGDRYVIRGHEARSDVFIDGLRDPGMTTRESFAAEQIEVTKGPSSTFAGRGSTGGAINTITKKASTEYDFTSIDAGLGTDEYVRVTIDSNKRISDRVAVRANLLYGYKEIPDRDPAEEDRFGALLSASYAPNDRLELMADYYHLTAEDIPDLGTYFVDGTPEPDPLVYLQEDRDFLDTKVDTFTFKARYAFNEHLRFENGFRYGETDNGYIVSIGGSQGTQSRTQDGWQEVEYLGNQANLFYDMELGGREHRIVLGVEYTEETVENGRYGIQYDPSSTYYVEQQIERRGRVFTRRFLDVGQAIADGVNPAKLWSGTVSKAHQDSDFDIETVSLYLMDTFDLTDQLTVFAGVRHDDFDYSNNVLSGGDTVRFAYDDGVWNYHGSLTYHFLEDANVYFTYSTASNINGGESDVGGNCGYGGICGDPDTIGQGDPEETENLEAGLKWELFDEKLLASLAVFEITKDDVMESNAVSDYETTGTYNTGKNRVEGFELSVVGNLTKDLSMQLGFAKMESKIIESHDPEDVGKPLANFANESANLLVRYQATPALSAGLAATFKGRMYVGQPDAAANTNRKVPSYTSFDVFANYRISPAMSLRFNANNITDEDIFVAGYRSGGFVYIGERRNAYVTLTYDF